MMRRILLHPILEGGRLLEGSPQNLYSHPLGSPAAASATAVLPATAPGTITTGITNPDVARNLTATPVGTAGNVLAVSVVVAGTDIAGNAITETLPAFTAGSLAAVAGSKAFKTVTSITIPAAGTGITVSVGVGVKLGLPRRLPRDSMLNVSKGGATEGTRPTIATDPGVLALNTITLASAPNGTPVVVDAYAP
jgi:hypothetical protein